MKIFISVASFVDPYLLFTVQDGIAKAKYPVHLVFGVVISAQKIVVRNCKC